MWKKVNKAVWTAGSKIMAKMVENFYKGCSRGLFIYITAAFA
jgi:hypothetical protein